MKSILIGSVVCKHNVNQYIPGKRYGIIYINILLLSFHYFRIVCTTSPTETGVITENITVDFNYTEAVSSRRPFQFLVSHNYC